jgi:DNA-directed RNA polymerase subunit M/transcription elongation factor TFIIS
MYYLRLSETGEDTLTYYCRKCGHENSQLGPDTVCVMQTNIRGGNSQYGHVVNRYTKLDPTLPRTNMIKCPSQSCPSNKEGQEREVIYLRYDDTRMKYMYLCAVCDTTWKTGEQS